MKMERITPEAIKDRLVALDPEKAADVSRWEVEIGEDSVGGPAVFVTVVYRDDRLHAAWSGHKAYQELLRQRLVDLLPDHWAYVRLSAESISADPLMARS